MFSLPAPINRLFTAALLVIVLIACQKPESKLEGIKIEHQAEQ